MRKNITILFVLFICVTSQAQDASIRDYMSKSVNLYELDSLKSVFANQNSENEKSIAQFLSDNPSYKRKFNEGDVIKEIAFIDNGKPIYNRTFNVNGSKTVRADRLNTGGSLGLNLQGQGMYVGVWDGGSARFTHQEFGGRTQIVDDAVVSNHATHVTGTIIGSGVTNATIKGIAYQANSYNYDWTNDITEMTSAFQNLNLLVSNHSYGADASSVSLWFFGAYDSKARSVDALANTSQYYLPVVAAGNDRDSYQTYNPTKNGFDLIGGFNSAKNVITVGAVNQVLNYLSPSNVIMSDFSNWGPTDDGRIKPDVVAKGVSVRSATSATDISSGFLNGTSMASPAVAGVALLLQQHHINLFQQPMYASTVKGLILHTADEAGIAPGPDYMFGWGLVNAEKAANTITNSGTSSIVRELALDAANPSYTTSVQVGPNTPLMVSISWTDRAPVQVNTGTVDLQRLMLVNDLDVRVTKDGTTYYPWTLDPANPSFPASNLSDNFRDNFEKVEIGNPSGAYTITVTHKGNLTGGQQRFSLIVTGDQVQTLSNKNPNLDNIISLYPNPAKNTLNVNLTTLLDNATLSVIDLQGRVVNTQSVLDTTATIDVANLQSGVYVVRIDSAAGSYTKKFIKE